MKLHVLFIWVVGILCFSCGDDDSYSNPEELIFSMTITEDYDRTASKVDALKEYLSAELDMPVKIFRVSNGSATIEAVKAEKVHMGGIGAFSYLVAKSKIDIDPLVTTESASPDTIHQYWSHLIVPANSALNTIEDLKRNVGDLSLTWSYPTSTSGHLIPRGHLQDIGIYPEDFKEVMVAENHVSAVYNCIKGKVDVAAVSNTTLAEYERRGKISKDDYKSIWSSDPIIRGVLFINNKVNPELKEKIITALITMYDKSPETARKIHYNYNYDVKYVGVSDTDYDPLRKIAKKIGALD